MANKCEGEIYPYIESTEQSAWPRYAQMPMSDISEAKLSIWINPNYDPIKSEKSLQWLKRYINDVINNDGN